LWECSFVVELHEFSHKTDVWSFGVTFWEIISLADRPYNGMAKVKIISVIIYLISYPAWAHISGRQTLGLTRGPYPLLHNKCGGLTPG
jgi:hypothetical protein